MIMNGNLSLDSILPQSNSLKKAAATIWLSLPVAARCTVQSTALLKSLYKVYNKKAMQQRDMV